jgi:hypothetical protein
MARIFIDGFESGGSGLWDVVSNGSVDAAQSGMSGSYNLNLLNAVGYAYKVLAVVSEGYFKLRRRWISAGYNTCIWSVWNGSTVLAQLWTISGVLWACRAGTQLAVGTAVIAADTTYLFEIYFKLDDSDGRFVVKVNGTTDIDFTGDTKPDSNTTFDRVRLGSDGSQYGLSYFDDFVYDDAAWIGPSKIQKKQITGAGTTGAWTPSAGNAWDCVDEIPPSDTDYIYDNTVDHVSTFAGGNLSGSIAAIKCVQIEARTQKEGTPTPQNIQVACRSGGVDSFGSSYAPTTSWTTPFRLMEVDPATNNAWLTAAVNALEIGVKAVA